ncbi:MAG: hypothetical protein IKW35_06630 [Paludibacteraceae bacterium]|nr:hypothetical protein [Paludibacteraceae bacterium]
MSKNVNVFIGVLLCAVLCGTFVWLSSSGDESSWSPNDIYNEVQGAGSVGGYATTSATFSGPSNEGGVALPMSSSSMRARSSYKYAGAYSGAATMPLTSNLSPLTYGAASGAGLYTTSSAEIKSFGGGGNGGAATGGAMSNVRSNSGLSNPSLQGGAGVGTSPIAYSTARRGGMSSVAGDDLAMMAAENPVMAMTNAASVGMGNGFYGAYSVMDYSSASYAEYTGMFGGGSRMGVRGRQNAGPGNNESNWLNWLALNGKNFGSLVDGVWMLDVYALRNAYDEYCRGWNETMGGKMPTWDEWLAWFMGSEDSPFVWSDGENSSSYQFLPVGDILPLFFLALLYVLFVAIKKSLLKTERSE